MFSGTDGDSPSPAVESDSILRDHTTKIKQEFNLVPLLNSQRNEMGPLGSLMDPRLVRKDHMFSNTDLVGTVEKTLSILGLENAKTESEPIPKKKVKVRDCSYNTI